MDTAGAKADGRDKAKKGAATGRADKGCPGHSRRAVTTGTQNREDEDGCGRKGRQCVVDGGSPLAVCCNGKQCGAPGLGNSGGNLGGRRGLGSGGGRVGRVHCGRQDLAVEWVNGCPLHGLDMEYSVGVGVLQVNSNWPKALMIRTEQDGYYPFY